MLFDVSISDIPVTRISQKEFSDKKQKIENSTEVKKVV
jgi:hypothetical protein